MGVRRDLPDRKQGTRPPTRPESICVISPWLIIDTIVSRGKHTVKGLWQAIIGPLSIDSRRLVGLYRCITALIVVGATFSIAECRGVDCEPQPSIVVFVHTVVL